MSGINLGKGTAVAASPVALRIRFNDAKIGTRWVPKSVLHDDSEVYQLSSDPDGKVIVMEWWADKEGLSDVGKGSKR